MNHSLTSLLDVRPATSPAPGGGTVKSIYGDFVKEAKPRIDLTYDYEHAQICAFKRAALLLGPSRFIDVGANIGVYSVYLSDVPSLVSIHAFEPTPSCFLVLGQNIGLTRTPDKISAAPVALSHKDGSMDFAIYGKLAGNNAIADTNHSNTPPPEIARVATRKLDSVIQARGETFVCKIDVEGHELRVIEGAKTYLQTNRGLLQVESFPEHHVALRSELAQLGYDLVFKMKNDFFFTNLRAPEQRVGLTEILFDEVGKALALLQELKLKRRLSIRHTRQLLDSIKYGADPVIVRPPAP